MQMGCVCGGLAHIRVIFELEPKKLRWCSSRGILSGPTLFKKHVDEVKETSCARFYSFGWVWRSRELLTYTFSSFWTGYAFARTSCVFGFILLDRLRVRENFLRIRFHPFGQVTRSQELLTYPFHPFGMISRSRELLAYTISSFWTGYAFARTSLVHGFILLE
jgi:hypothetical protein